MQKIIFIIAAIISLHTNASTSIDIGDGSITATLDSDNSKVLYDSLKIRPISIALGHYKEFHIKGELRNLRDYYNDLSIECTEKLQTTHECIIMLNSLNSWRTMLIKKNDYFNLVIISNEVKKQLMKLIPRAFITTDKGVIINCHTESSCFVALFYPPPVPEKHQDKGCIIFWSIR